MLLRVNLLDMELDRGHRLLYSLTVKNRRVLSLSNMRKRHQLNKTESGTSPADDAMIAV